MQLIALLHFYCPVITQAHEPFSKDEIEFANVSARSGRKVMGISLFIRDEVGKKSVFSFPKHFEPNV